MKTLNCGWSLTLVAAICFGAGCGKDKTPAPADGPGPAAGGASAKPGPADSADKAVLAVIEGLKNDHLEALWDYLPGIYQKDLNDLVHTFAERMDGELWARTVSVIRKLAGVLKTKNEFLRRPAAEGNPASGPEQSATDWVKLAEILESILDSDLADLEKLKKADTGKILAGTGGKIFGQLRAFSKLMSDDSFAEKLDRLSRTEVKLISSSTDKAVLTLTASGDEPDDIAFVRVEGKWIPQSMADAWIETIGEARARLSVLSPETFAEQKPQYLSLISVIDGVLDKLAAAKTRDAFSAAIQEGMATLIPMIAAVAGPPQSGPGDGGVADPEAPAAAELVTIVVQATLDEDAQNDLRDKLNAVTDDRERAATELTGDDESTIFKVGPVSDIQAFARQLEFLKVTDVDVKSRTITAGLKK